MEAVRENLYYKKQVVIQKHEKFMIRYHSYLTSELITLQSMISQTVH